MERKKIFNIIGIIGIIIICILSFIIPENPYIIIPAISVNGFDKPLWFCLIVIFSFLYSIILYFLYTIIRKRM